MKRESASPESTVIWLIYVILLCHGVLMLLGEIWERTRGEVSLVRLPWVHRRLPPASCAPEGPSLEL